MKVLIDDFFEAAGYAITFFSNINHWKGLSNIYRLIAEVVKQHEITGEQLMNQNTLHISKVVNESSNRNLLALNPDDTKKVMIFSRYQHMQQQY